MPSSLPNEKTLLEDGRVCLELLRTNPSAAAGPLARLVARAQISPLHAVIVDLVRTAEAFFVGRYADAETIGRAGRAAAIEIGAEAVCADIEVLLGNVSLERGEFVAAATWYTTAAARLEPRGDHTQLGRVYNNLGLVAWRMGDLPRAESHFDHALRLFGADGDPRTIGNIHSNLGLVYEDSGDTSAAEAAWRRAIALLADAGDDSFHANALSNLGELLEARGTVAAAQDLHEKALALRRRVGHTRGEVTSRVALARTALALGETERASAHVEAALDLARGIGVRKQEADALSLRARVLEHAGRYADALADERAAARLREQVFGDQMTERVAALQLGFDAAQAKAEARWATAENTRLQAAIRAAAEATAARDRFLAMMSHELRTPLTSAIGAAEILRTTALDARQRHLVEAVAASAEALLAAIGDVLDFTRADIGSLQLAREAVNPRQVAEQVLAIVSPAASEKRLPVRLTFGPDVPIAVVTDTARLRQLLLNLVANAVKFTDRGAVDLRIDAAPGGVCIQVIDTGIGIPDDAAPHIFEPFTQADSSSTRRHGGSGLGLALCRRIVDAMGGTITFRSAVGLGTTVTVTVPLAATAPAPPAPAALGDAAARFTALLVEDDHGVREVIGELLDWCGADVTPAASAEEALALYAAAPVDLVVLDVHMPRMDGLTCARLLRERHGPAVRILGLSGATSEDNRRAALAAGFDGWLAKPTTARQLRAELDRLGFGGARLEAADPGRAPE